MNTLPADPIAVRRARRTAARQLGFLIHAAVFLVVNLALLAVLIGSGRPVSHAWPLAGWGLGLAIHALVALAPLWRLRDALIARALHRQARG